MESVMVKNHTVSGYNKQQNRAPKKKNNNNNSRSFSPKSSENLAPMSFHGSLSHFPHRSLAFSNPISSSPLLSRPYQYQQSPPLLPLPVAPISRNLSLSLSPAKQSLHRARVQSANTPRKQRSKLNNNPKPAKSELDEPLAVVASTNRLGPEPVSLPKDVPKIWSSIGSVVVVADHLEKFTGGSALSLLSPPPSSLPLPRFSLRPAAPKLSCNAERRGSTPAPPTIYAAFSVSAELNHSHVSPPLD